jgi:serine/threonine protein phosphatase PrpC
VLRSAQGVVVDAAMLSDPGRDPDKQVNEDAVAISETGFGITAVVCDGMGGHERGELASRLAVERILEVLRSGDQPLDRLLSSAIERAHAEVYALGGNAPIDARPGSTAVVLAISNREALIAHVGDSRAYRIRARRIERLTRDHSVVEALLAAGAITLEQANLHPDANRITRALGIAPEIEPEVSPPVHVEPGDAFVLCTDGLSDLVTDAEIGEIVSGSMTPAAACESLVGLANQRGGHDNVSVDVLRVLALGAPRRAGETVGLAAPPHVPARGDTQTPPTAPEAQTVVAQPGFTVVMGAKEGGPRPGYTQEPPRQTAPTLVDPLIAASLPHKTLPGEDPVPPTPANAVPMTGFSPQPAIVPEGPAPSPAATTIAEKPPAAARTQVSAIPLPDGTSSRPTLDAVPRMSSVRAPREGEVRLLIWATVALSALVLLIVVGWWLLR